MIKGSNVSEWVAVKSTLYRPREFAQLLTIDTFYPLSGLHPRYRAYIYTMSTIETTYPYETTSPGVARHQCTECGGWERSDKGTIRHSKRCESRAQVVTVAAPSVKSTNELRDFGSKVRRTGMTGGRDEDVLAAVRQGHLSVSDAMNTDD